MFEHSVFRLAAFAQTLISKSNAPEAQANEQNSEAITLPPRRPRSVGVGDRSAGSKRVKLNLNKSREVI